MARGSKGMHNHNTTTLGKLAVIEWQKSIVHAQWHGQALPGWGVSVPGCGEQLERHIKELEDYGIDQSRQIMVERDEKTYWTLVKAAKTLGFKGKVVHGTLESVVFDLWDRGETVDVIDYDDIGYLQQKHLDLIETAAKHHVKVFILVLTTRGCASGLGLFLQTWANRLRIKQHWERRWKHFTYSWKEVQSKTVKHVAKKHGFTHSWTPYKGKVSMMTNILIKK